MNRTLVIGLFVCASASGLARGQCQYQWLRAASAQFFAGPNGASVRDAVVFDDGAGPALFTGGYSGTIDGAPLNCIAKWNGQQWSSPGGGVTWPGMPNDALIYALCAHDDGSGPALYAGGNFRMAGGAPAIGIARWNGQVWSVVGAPLAPDDVVTALVSWDDPSIGGHALIAGGVFRVGPGPSDYVNVMKWDGVSWAPLGALQSGASCFAIGPAGPMQGLYAASGLVSRWTGAAWESVGDPNFSGSVYVIGFFDPDGAGAQPASLYAGGDFRDVNGSPAVGLARWDGAAWHGGMDIVAHPGSPSPFFRYVSAIETFDDGGGPALFIGGTFGSVAGVTASSVARLRNGVWSGAPGGFQALQGAPIVEVLRAIDLPKGPALFAGGAFSHAGSAQTSNIARLGVVPACCPGDADGDRDVDFADLNHCLGAFGGQGYMLPGDVNEDGTVNFADLNVVLSNYGDGC